MLREEFPWLTDEDLGIMVARCAKRSTLPCAPYKHPSELEHISEDSDDGGLAVAAVDVDDVFEALGHMKEDFADHTDVDGVHYYTRLRKGEWAIAHIGVWSDAIGCFSRAHVRRGFLKAYKAPQQKTFAHEKYGGAASSRMLALEWVRKLDYFCTIYYESGEAPDLDFTLAASHCDEDPVFIDYACELDLDSEEFGAVTEVRNFVPVPRH